MTKKDTATQTITDAFNPEMWQIRAQGYANLGWVNSANLLDHIVQILELTGQETIIDAGAGSLAVSKVLADHVAKVQAFDISPDMLAGATQVPANVEVNPNSISIYENGYLSSSADHLVARMVFHHLDQLEVAVRESLRVVKEAGSIVISEYIVPDEECYQFERAVFDIKEPDRHLWTPDSIRQSLTEFLDEQYEVQITYQTMEQYSVGDWLSKSGLPESEQQAMFALYLAAPTAVREKMNLTYVQYDGDQLVPVDPASQEVHDVLVDRLFAYVHIKKQPHDTTAIAAD